VEETDVAREPVLGLLELAQALRVAGDDPVAERLLEAAVWARPQEVMLPYTLGKLFEEQRPPRWGEAVRCYAAARALRPELGEALANAMVNSGGGGADKGLSMYEQLVNESKDNPWLHFRRGHALGDQGRYKEAEAAYREALCLNPDYPLAHNNLGNALADQGRLKEAEAAWREALRLRPDFLEAHGNLGNVLIEQGRYQEAETEFREALRLRPDIPEAHYDIGNILRAWGRHEEAEAAYRAALRLRPDYAEAHCNLGIVLQDQGRFAEALVELHRGHDLGRKTPRWSYPSAEWVRECERLVELESRLPSLLRGQPESVTAAERLAFAQLCGYKRMRVTASRLYVEAFAADPRLANDLRAGHRYDAACFAALAAAGQADDARQLPDKVVLMLRRQALRWLRADLALYALPVAREEAAARQAVRQGLVHWQQDSDLATVRDPAALDWLPADEREQWRRLWEEVAALLKNVEEKK
jgi:tetratricopeptide (TPR) repeat protein